MINNSPKVEKKNFNMSDGAQPLGFDAKFRGALKRIGKLRNDFAHDLSSSLSQQVVSDLYRSLDRRPSTSP